MQEPAIIAERLNTLQSLYSKEVILLNDVQEEFRSDLRNFMTGQTITLQKGEVVVGSNLYKRWLVKVQTQGFDCEINFKK